MSRPKHSGARLKGNGTQENPCSGINLFQVPEPGKSRFTVKGSKRQELFWILQLEYHSQKPSLISKTSPESLSPGVLPLKKQLLPPSGVKGQAWDGGVM